MDGKLVPSLSWEVLDLRTTPTSQSDGHVLVTTGLHAAFNLRCLVVTLYSTALAFATKVPSPHFGGKQSLFMKPRLHTLAMKKGEFALLVPRV